MLLRTMGPKTRAEIQRAYRERKKQRDGDTKKPKKPRNDVQRSYREKKKLENKDAFLEKERNRKRKSYIPISLLTETEQAKRRKANREKSMRFREKSRRNKNNLESPSTAGSENNIHKIKTEIERLGEVAPVQGTMTVHAVAAISPGKIIARKPTCYCHQCFRDGTYNPESPCGWKIHLLKEFSDTTVTPVVGDWVAAVYDNKWYVGKVVEADPLDSDALITFMQSTTKQVGFLKWPLSEDQVWIDFKSILAIIEPPIPSGKRQRQFRLHDETSAMIEGLFAIHQANRN